MTPADFHTWRLSRRLSQREAADLLGIQQARVSAMETGKAPVSRQTERQLEMLGKIEMLTGYRIGTFGITRRAT